MDNDMLEAYLFEMNTLLEQIDELEIGRASCRERV